MDLSLTAEHEMVRRMARDFAQREVAPNIKEWDRNKSMAPNILPRIADLGFLGVCIPVRYGGEGMDYLSLGLVCEELEAVDTSLRVILTVHSALTSLTLLQWGSEGQKRDLLFLLARGEALACGAFSEPGAGSDIQNIQANGRRDGSDFILNGDKTWISLASIADVALVTVRTRPEAEDHVGLTAFIVDLNSRGVTRGEIHDTLGMRAIPMGWISLQDVRVPAGNMVGKEGEGFNITMSAINSGSYTVAAGATGLIRASLEASIKYAKERRAYGAPLAEHQLVQDKIASMAQDYEVAKLLYFKAGWLRNGGKQNTLETSMAKQFATEAAFRAASEALQIHGSHGYSDEYPVERFLRNARGAMIDTGSNEIQTLIQAGYALGTRVDEPLRCELPAYDEHAWKEEGS